MSRPGVAAEGQVDHVWVPLQAAKMVRWWTDIHGRVRCSRLLNLSFRQVQQDRMQPKTYMIRRKYQKA